jgi:hypothetical protein
VIVAAIEAAIHDDMMVVMAAALSLVGLWLVLAALARLVWATITAMDADPGRTRGL